MFDRLYHPAGFTRTQEVRAIMDQYEPEKMYNYPNNLGGTVHFVGLTVEDARNLLDLLPDGQQNDQQNWAPTFAEFLALGDEFPDILFHGYRVVETREDERITIEGFLLPIEMANANMASLIERFDGEHAEDGAEEFYEWEWNGETYLRAWWD